MTNLPTSRILLDCPQVPGGPAHDVALGPALLRAGLENAVEIVRIFSPRPTMAFSRRDTLRPGFEEAIVAARRTSFEPVIRFPGGSLAAYHPGSVVIDHVCRRKDPGVDVDGRFALYAGQVVDLLTALGVDARIGPVPGEYCPGRFTVNGGGTVKLAGSAQRVTPDGWLFSTVLQVTGAPLLRQPLAMASQALGYDLDLATVGAVEDLRPATTVAEVTEALQATWRARGARVVDDLPEGLLRVIDEVVAGNMTDAKAQPPTE